MHCGLSAPGTHVRVVITCKKVVSPYSTTSRVGPWKWQGGGYSSIAYCPSNHYVAYRSYQTTS